MPSYVSQLRYTQGIYNIAALAGSLDGRGHMIWAGEERCFEPQADFDCAVYTFAQEAAGPKPSINVDSDLARQYMLTNDRTQQNIPIG